MASISIFPYFPFQGPQDVGPDIIIAVLGLPDKDLLPVCHLCELKIQGKLKLNIIFHNYFGHFL